MTTFKDFAAKAKIRPDFGDMIQVRYVHSDGDDYDTWISGEEVLQRLASETAEERLRSISKLECQSIKEAKDRLPEEVKKNLRRKLIDRFADEVKGAVGGNIICDSFADDITCEDATADPYEAERQKWRTQLQEDAFRGKVLELAWIQLEGSFPDDDHHQREEPDDWV
jgi:hypothetical protein